MHSDGLGLIWELERAVWVSVAFGWDASVTNFVCLSLGFCGLAGRARIPLALYFIFYLDAMEGLYLFAGRDCSVVFLRWTRLVM
jgi:hypothetical protein